MARVGSRTRGDCASRETRTAWQFVVVFGGCIRKADESWIENSPKQRGRLSPVKEQTMSTPSKCPVTGGADTRRQVPRQTRTGGRIS